MCVCARARALHYPCHIPTNPLLLGAVEENENIVGFSFTVMSHKDKAVATRRASSALSQIVDTRLSHSLPASPQRIG